LSKAQTALQSASSSDLGLTQKDPQQAAKGEIGSFQRSNSFEVDSDEKILRI
jgi:hypothetical protein